jgi:hypothetical protein
MVDHQSELESVVISKNLLVEDCEDVQTAATPQSGSFSKRRTFDGKRLADTFPSQGPIF